MPTTVTPSDEEHVVARDRCRYCGAARSASFLSLGDQPPSNAFLRPDEIAAEERYPLDVFRCTTCQLVQLTHTVSPKRLFTDYAYLSSSSKALVEHYRELARRLAERGGARAGDVVVDIGCNDGALLLGYRADLRRVGVEPSNVAEVARSRGLPVISAFFGEAVADRIVAEHGSAIVVTATNVFAHVDDVHAFVAGVARLLHPEGTFVIEAPYLLDMIDGVLFDVIYHEHLAYLSLTPLVPLFDAHGLAVVDVERVPFGASGPALRVSVGRRGSVVPAASVERTLEAEAAWGIDRADRYETFANDVARLGARIRGLLAEVGGAGEAVAGYGAPAKGNTLLNYLRVTSADIPYIADAARTKQGLLTPGSHIPIVSEEELLSRAPRYALLLAWNYLEFFMRESEFVRRGGRFIVPLPEPRVMA